MRSAWIVALLFIAGCGSGATDPLAGSIFGRPILQASEISGPWTLSFQNDPPECFNFDRGRLIFFSDGCDGFNELVSPTNVELNGNNFSLEFPVASGGTQGTITFIGTVVSRDRIDVDTFGVVVPGQGQISASLPGTVLQRD